MKSSIMFTVTFLVMISTAQACTLTSSLPPQITGNTDYELNYSCALPGTAVFILQSPYALLNNTPELDYVYLADNCITETTNDTIILMCPGIAPESNMSCRFRFAPNIMPGKYTFSFGIAAEPEQPQPTPPPKQSGSSSSAHKYTNTKTVIVDITRHYDGFDYDLIMNLTGDPDNDTLIIEAIKSTLNVSDPSDPSEKWISSPDNEEGINPVWWLIILVGIGVITIGWINYRNIER